MEELLELPVGPVLEGIGEVAPVLGHLQEGGEVGRPVDLGLWRGTLELPSSLGGGLVGHLHGSGWHGVGGLDKGRLDAGVPGKKQHCVGSASWVSCIFENCLATTRGAMWPPLVKSESKVLVQTRRTSKTMAKDLEGLEGGGDEP